MMKTNKLYGKLELIDYFWEEKYFLQGQERVYLGFIKRLFRIALATATLKSRLVEPR